MSTGRVTEGGWAMTIWRKPELLAMLLVIAAILALMPAGDAEAAFYRFNDKGDACAGASVVPPQTTTLITATTTGCSSPDVMSYRNPIGTGDLPIVMGYFANGGYSTPMTITGLGTGNDIGIQTPGDTAALGYVHLVEVNPSTGTIIQTLDTHSWALTTAKQSDLSALSGMISQGTTFGLLISADYTANNQRHYVYWGGDDLTAERQVANLTVGIGADGLQVTNTGTSATFAQQGSRTVMLYFRIAEVNNVGGSPVVDKIKIDDIGDNADTNVDSVSIYLSSDTAWDAGDTLLGTGTFNNSTVTIDITDQTISGAPTTYFLVVYNVYLDADDVNDSLQASMADQTYIIPVSPSYTQVFSNITGTSLDITYTAKDRVEMNDTEVWSSGYLERGVVNAPIFSMSLHVIESFEDGQAYLQSFKVDNIGSVPASDITAVKAWMSSDEDLDISTDTKIHTAASYTFNPVTNSVTIPADYNAFANTISATKKYIFITYDISASAATTNWLEAEVVNEKYATLVNPLSKGVVNSFYGFQSNSLPIRPANFKVINECYECHTFPPLDSPEPAVKKRNPYSGAVVGDHERVSHVGGNNESDCEVCHDVPGGNMNHQDGWLSMNSPIGEQGVYNRPSLQHSNVTATDVCYNTVCHGDLAYSPQWGIGTIHCIDCHTENQPDTTQGPRRSTFVDMQSSSSHHIYNSTAIPDATCEVCHLRSNHTREGDPDVRLFNGDTGAAILYDGTGASMEEACVSCHDTDGVDRLGQNALKPFYASGDFNNVPDIGWKNGQSAHDLAANIATDKCMACHGNSGGSSTNSLNPAISAHGSDQPKMLRYTYDTNSPETYCFSCHDGTGANRNIYASFQLTSGIKSSHSRGRENCLMCHDVHRAEQGLHVPGLPTIQIGNVAIMEGRTAEYQICFDPDPGTCHNAARVMSGTASNSYADTQYAGGANYFKSLWKSIPNIQAQFSTTQYAYHPLFAQGRNQPSGSENSNWASAAERKSDASASGLDHTFVDGWGQSSLVTCTDCHDNSGWGHTGARGPHGSTMPWILRSMDNTNNIKVTTAGGTIYPNTGFAVATTGVGIAIANNFCVNCHRADVYGDGFNEATDLNLSRMAHDLGSGCMKNHFTGGSNGGGYTVTGCMNCHGGGEIAGIHGTSQGAGTYGTDMGKRFMNGAAWSSHTLGDVSGNLQCYTSSNPAYGATTTSCSKHAGTKGVGKTPDYYYSWQ